MSKSAEFEITPRDYRDEFPRIHSTRNHSITLEELELKRQAYLGTNEEEPPLTDCE